MMSGRHGEHEEAVERWAAREPRELTPEEVLFVYPAALAAVWGAARNTVSAITLMAILERAVLESSDGHPFLSAITVEEGGASWEKVSAPGLAGEELEAGAKRLLSTFLGMLGAVTNEVLSPYLHQTLEAVPRRAPPKVIPLRKAQDE